MTDEQWLWLFANQALDADERLEGMCDHCRDEVTSKTFCTRCGKVISNNKDNDGEETFVNKNFDMDKYEAMKNGTYKPEIPINEEENNPLDGDVDMDLVNQILNSSVGDSNG